MSVYDLIIQNKELLKIFYALAIGLICTIIVVKTNRLFQLSLHQGIRYFRNAFLFYGLAFIIRYLGGAMFFSSYLGSSYFFTIKILFEFFLVMAGFFLLYSLLWKKFEVVGKGAFSSLFNSKILIFYAMAFMIVVADSIWKTYSFMFFSQILLFFIAAIISYLNYKKNGKQHKFLKFYFVAMVLSLIAWMLNAVASLFLNWSQGILINVYVINIIIFLLFLFGVVKLTRVK